MAELLPCPFCGGESKLVTHSFWNEKKQNFSDKTYSVKCCNCSVETYQFYETEEKATEAWNIRTEKPVRSIVTTKDDKEIHTIKICSIPASTIDKLLKESGGEK